MKVLLKAAIFILISTISSSAFANTPTCFDLKVINGGVYVLEAKLYHRDSHCKGNDSTSLTKGKGYTFHVSANTEVKLQAVGGRSQTVKVKQILRNTKYQTIHCGGTTFEGFGCRYVY